MDSGFVNAHQFRDQQKFAHVHEVLRQSLREQQGTSMAGDSKGTDSVLLRYRTKLNLDADVPLLKSPRRVMTVLSNSYTPHAHASCLTRCMFHFLFR